MGKSKQAFTIVELLVVIVVIGILAAITIVSYSGIQKRAIGSNLQSDLSSDARQLKMYNVEYGHYPSSLDTNYCPATPEQDTRYCLKSMNGAKLSYVGGGQAFTLFDKHTATGITYKISEGSEPAVSVLPASFINLYGAGNAADAAIAVDITSDDGYVVSGFKSGLNMYAKFGADNSLLTAKCFSNNGVGSITAIKKTSDGGVILAGALDMSTYPSDPGFGYNDMQVIKFSSTNQISWMRLWGINNSDVINDIIQTSDGGYAATGSSGGKMVILKITNEGTLSWAKTYGSGTGNSIIQTSDSGFAVAGNGSYAMALKTDPSGALSWAKYWYDTPFLGGSQSLDIIQTADNGYAVAGKQTVSAGRMTSSIIKLASDGSYQWHNYLAASNNIGLQSIVQAYDGGYALAGGMVDVAKAATKGDAVLVKISSSGTLSWSRNFGYSVDSESASGLALAADGGYLMVGKRWINGTGSSYQMLTMKYKSDGTMNGCVSPICKSNLVWSNGDGITFTNATLTATSQSYGVMSKKYNVYDATFSQTVVAAP